MYAKIPRLRYETKPLDELAQLCLDHRLYHRGWILQSNLRLLRAIKMYQQAWTLIVAFHGRIPVGCVCISGPISLKMPDPNHPRGFQMTHGELVSFYVKRRYRRQGIATRLVRKLKQERGTLEGLLGLRGESQSVPFFRKLGLIWTIDQ